MCEYSVVGGGGACFVGWLGRGRARYHQKAAFGLVSNDRDAPQEVEQILRG